MSTVVYPNIAFIGKAGSGKSTAAALLVDHYGYEKLSFAAPLKIMLGPNADRVTLQDVGVDVRDIVADGWVNLLLHELSRAQKKWEGDGTWRPRFVVDDCRFPNEAAALQAEGFVLVRVTAHEALRRARLTASGKWGGEASLNHISETALDRYQVAHKFANDGTRAELVDTVAAIMDCEAR